MSRSTKNFVSIAALLALGVGACVIGFVFATPRADAAPAKPVVDRSTTIRYDGLDVDRDHMWARITTSKRMAFIEFKRASETKWQGVMVMRGTNRVGLSVIPEGRAATIDIRELNMKTRKVIQKKSWRENNDYQERALIAENPGMVFANVESFSSANLARVNDIRVLFVKANGLPGERKLELIDIDESSGTASYGVALGNNVKSTTKVVARVRGGLVMDPRARG